MAKTKFHKILSKTLHKVAKTCQQFLTSYILNLPNICKGIPFRYETILPPFLQNYNKTLFKSYESHCQHRLKFQSIYNQEIYKKDFENSFVSNSTQMRILRCLFQHIIINVQYLINFKSWKVPSFCILINCSVLMAPHQLHKIM